MARKKIATSVEELENIVNIDNAMIASHPKIGRRNAVATILRSIADSIENGDVNSLPSIQWSGTNSCSGTINFFDSGIENFNFEMS